MPLEIEITPGFGIYFTCYFSIFAIINTFIKDYIRSNSAQQAALASNMYYSCRTHFYFK